MAETLTQATEGAGIGQTTTEGMPQVNLPSQQNIQKPIDYSGMSKQQKLNIILKNPDMLTRLKQFESKKQMWDFTVANLGVNTAGKLFTEGNYNNSQIAKLVTNSQSDIQKEMSYDYNLLKNIKTKDDGTPLTFSEKYNFFIRKHHGTFNTTKDQTAYTKLSEKLFSFKKTEDAANEKYRTAKENLLINNKNHFQDAKDKYYNVLLKLEGLDLPQNSDFEELIFKQLGGKTPDEDIRMSTSYKHFEGTPITEEGTGFNNISLDDFDEALDAAFDRILYTYKDIRDKEGGVKRLDVKTINIDAALKFTEADSYMDANGMIQKFSVRRTSQRDKYIEKILEVGGAEYETFVGNLENRDVLQRIKEYKNLLRGHLISAGSSLNEIKPISTLVGTQAMDQSKNKIEGF